MTARLTLPTRRCDTTRGRANAAPLLLGLTMTNDAPYQIKRVGNMQEAGKYDFQLIEVATKKIVMGEYRASSPIAPPHMRKAQAQLNSKAVLDSLKIF